MKIEVQCTNCKGKYEIDTDSFVLDICPLCGKEGTVKFRIPGRWEDQEEPEPGRLKAGKN